jgi:hypothetical protein
MDLQLWHTLVLRATPWGEPMTTTFWNALKSILAKWQRSGASRRLDRIAADIKAYGIG